MKIGEVLKEWRYGERMGIREAAGVIGISHSTLSRIENGKPMDGDTLAKILTWLMS